jgi:hypothetical protein
MKKYFPQKDGMNVVTASALAAAYLFIARSQVDFCQKKETTDIASFAAPLLCAHAHIIK